MTIKHGEANPLNVHGLREISTCPPHFAKVAFTSYIDAPRLRAWLYENLDGRFIIKAKNNYTIEYVGFEIPAEASYFALMQDHIFKIDTEF